VELQPRVIDLVLHLSERLRSIGRLNAWIRSRSQLDMTVDRANREHDADQREPCTSSYGHISSPTKHNAQRSSPEVDIVEVQVKLQEPVVSIARCRAKPPNVAPDAHVIRKESDQSRANIHADIVAIERDKVSRSINTRPNQPHARDGA
jgi:hypothetical protein